MTDRLRILVVEDEPEIATLIQITCEDGLGAVVDCASTSEAAIKFLKERRPSLAIIDLVLPGMCGFDVAQNAVDRHVPVLLMTGHPDHLVSCEGYGFPYLAKPFSVEYLVVAAMNAVRSNEENIKRLRRSLALRATRENSDIRHRASHLNDILQRAQKSLDRSHSSIKHR